MYHFYMFIFNYYLDRHIIGVSKSVSPLACESQRKCGSACRYSQGKLVQYNSGAHVLWRLTIFAKSPQISIIFWVITSLEHLLVHRSLTWCGPSGRPSPSTGPPPPAVAGCPQLPACVSPRSGACRILWCWHTSWNTECSCEHYPWLTK